MSETEAEIYVRPSGDRVLLNFHLPDGVDLADLIASSQDPARAESGRPVAHLELSVMPEWCTDADQRRALEALGHPLHLRIPIDALNP